MLLNSKLTSQEGQPAQKSYHREEDNENGTILFGSPPQKEEESLSSHLFDDRHRLGYAILGANTFSK